MNTIQSCLILSGLALTATAAVAQPKTDGQWRGVAGGSVALSSGNSDTQAFLANIDMARLTAADKISLGGFINKAKNKTGGANVTTADKLGGSAQYDYNLNPQLFGFGRIALDRDEVAKIDLRTALSAGLGYKVINTKETTFDVMGGISNTRTKYSAPQVIGGTRSDSFSATGMYLAQESSHKLAESTTFKQRLEFYPGMSGEKISQTKFTAGLGVAMSKTLDLTMALQSNSTSKVAPGAKKTDTTLFTGVSVKLGQ